VIFKQHQSSFGAFAGNDIITNTYSAIANYTPNFLASVKTDTVLVIDGQTYKVTGVQELEYKKYFKLTMVKGTK
jgi:hypothetical protein